MNILVLLIFIGLVIMALGLVFFLFSIKNQDFEHGEQLSIMPLEEEEHGTDSNSV
ncbi:MAG: cbb3-type cytochrome oxidase assembly protein CcoS [Bdellovibrionales bacterium]|nr:cbb3-type cytochrome oxidase assembly protein CcoS [Bdellovibrionales bacterium]